MKLHVHPSLSQTSSEHDLCTKERPLPHYYHPAMRTQVKSQIGCDTQQEAHDFPRSPNEIVNKKSMTCIMKRSLCPTHKRAEFNEALSMT